MPAASPCRSTTANARVRRRPVPRRHASPRCGATPTVSERKVKSSISVETGQTVLLAGLISEQQNGTRTGIPVLVVDGRKLNGFSADAYDAAFKGRP